MLTYLDEKTQQANVLDERFYTQDNKTFYPSVTTVLNAYPKGSFFEQWLRDTGNNSKTILKQAGEQGTNVHNAIDDFLKGVPVRWIDDNGIAHFTLKEWQMINRFMKFFSCIDNVGFLSESIVFDKKLKLGGTMDLVCTIDGERWLIDYKTSNAIHKTYRMQLAMYKQMFENASKQKIDRYGVLWLNAKTRTDKLPFQGKGWQLKEFTEYFKDDFKLFGHTRAIWDEENPNYAPKNLLYPNKFKLTSDGE